MAARCCTLAMQNAFGILSPNEIFLFFLADRAVVKIFRPQASL
jgi:hypothetical protein